MNVKTNTTKQNQPTSQMKHVPLQNYYSAAPPTVGFLHSLQILVIYVITQHLKERKKRT